MHSRENALNEWLKIQLHPTSFTLSPLTGDASFRRYFRLSSPTGTYIVMDAPPQKEALTPFISIQNIFQEKGILSPMIHAVDVEQGFALIDDFGDRLFLQTLNDENRDTLYTHAIETLIHIQQCPNHALPVFDNDHMLKEMALFEEWFLGAYLNLSLTPAEKALIQSTTENIALRVARQPQVFIHRDYHSRNLMVVNEKLGVIDFQDAMLGPLTYDLTSLLKDCYTKLSHHDYQQYIDLFYQRQPLAQIWSLSTFKDEVDYCGLQRHLKILGIFCRLYLRDNKPNYLQDLPLAMDYTLTCLKRHSELHSLLQFMEKRVLPQFMEFCAA